MRVAIGDLELSIDGASLRGRAVDLGRVELRLLRVLATEPSRVFTKEELLRRLGLEAGATRTLDSHALRLRQKLGADGDRFVVNVWGVGYRLQDPPPAP